jgi:small-conductance mechanosensitive channel
MVLTGLSRSHADEPAPPPRALPDERDGEKALETSIVGRTPDEILGFLNQLAEQWIAVQGECLLVEHQFTQRVQELRKAREHLTALVEPKAKKVPMIFRAADVDVAVTTAQQLADFHANRQQRLEAVQAAAKVVLHAGVDRDLAWDRAQKHLRRMETAASLARTQPNVQVPPNLAPARFIDAMQWLTNRKTQATPLPTIDLRSLEEEIAQAAAVAASFRAEWEQLQDARERLVAVLAFRERLKELNPAQLAQEFTRLRALLEEKRLALTGDAADYAQAVEALTRAQAKRVAFREVPTGGEVPGIAGFSHQILISSLSAAQQQYSARIRAAEESAATTQAVIEAYENAEKRARSYAHTLDTTRLFADQLASVVAEIEHRIGSGELEAAKAPPSFHDAAQTVRIREQLTREAQQLAEAITQLSSQRNALRPTDDAGENMQMLTTALLGHVNQRLDLLTDLKKLETRYATAYKDRSEADQQRIHQRAAARMRSESAPWDALLAYDRSPAAADWEKLLSAYYRELIDLEEKQEILDQQKERLQKLIEFTRKEADDIAKLRIILTPQAAKSDAVGTWDQWLSRRLEPTGLEAEITAYRDEAARLNTLSGANARRIAELTGPSPTERDTSAPPQPAAGGEIGRVRAELQAARMDGLRGTGLRILTVLVAAAMIPRWILFLLRRRLRGGSDEAGNPSPVLAAVRGPLRIAVAVAALALILSILGFDVTALIVALAIAALAIALAARPMIADILGSLIIFAERRFQVGDVIRLGDNEPARVVGLTWRSTALKNSQGLIISMPNRKVTETTVETLSRGAETYDTITVTITTDKDAGKVINVIRAAMAQCKNLTPDHGVTVLSYNQKGNQKVVHYRFWWFLKDYEARNKTRDEVFARVALGLAHEDMGGIELTMA